MSAFPSSKLPRQMRRISYIIAMLTSILLLPQGAYAQDKQNAYPTVAIADYVFACMATNGETRIALEKCSCSIDIIASILPYEQFVEAETVMSMRLVGGEKSTLFRTGAEPKEAFARLKRAQAEAEIRCF